MRSLHEEVLGFYVFASLCACSFCSFSVPYKLILTLFGREEMICFPFSAHHTVCLGNKLGYILTRTCPPLPLE